VAVVEDPGGRSTATRPGDRAVLAELAARREPLPDLVLATTAGAAAAPRPGWTRSASPTATTGAVRGEQEGTVQVAVPLDDGLDPSATTCSATTCSRARSGAGVRRD